MGAADPARNLNPLAIVPSGLPSCPRCGRGHVPMTFVRWSWTLREYKPKPPGRQLGAVFILAAILDPRSGCGWLTNEQVADRAETDVRTVMRATDWAVSHMLLHRLVRGHRNWSGPSEQSLWALADPRYPNGTAPPEWLQADLGLGDP